MKRLFLVFVLFGVAGLALFAAWAGLRARTAYVAAVHEAGAHADVRVIESDFKRGWMRSTAETTLEVHGEVGAAFRLWMEALGAEAVRPRIGFTLRHEFLHGPASLWSWIATGFRGSPVMVEARTWVELDHESQTDAEGAIGRLPALLAATWVRLGGTSTDLFLPAGETRGIGGVRGAQWQNLDGLIEPQGHHLIGHGRLGAFQGEGAALSFRLQGIEWEFDSTRGSAQPARVAIRIPALSVRRRGSDGPWIIVHDLELGQGKAGSHGPNAAVAYIRFVRAEIGDEVYGPARFEIAAEPAVADDGLASPPEPDRAVRKVERALAMLPGFVLRAPHAEFTRLFLNSPSGPLHGGGDLYLASGGSGSIRRARLDLEAPVDVLEELREAWLPQAEAQGTPAWYDDWEAKGLLVRSDDRLRLRARVRDGSLTLNRVAAEEVFTFADEDEEKGHGEEATVAEQGEEATVGEEGEESAAAEEGDEATVSGSAGEARDQGGEAADAGTGSRAEAAAAERSGAALADSPDEPAGKAPEPAEAGIGAEAAVADEAPKPQDAAAAEPASAGRADPEASVADETPAPEAPPAPPGESPAANPPAAPAP